ncbi:Cysteine-rich receptor-like protein kinase [Populus alba x Populus x berolinensis]|nr:Cysteine-rich receptor-like protein kinase [Populus alba x Populus x berolinensis]
MTWENWNSGPNLDKLVDPTLRAASRNEMLRCIHVGLLCVQENAVDRPNMASVVIMLSSYSVTLPVPQGLQQLLLADIMGISFPRIV